MHFDTKSYLKSNRNHTAKQTLKHASITFPIFDNIFLLIFPYTIIFN
jgi:hypothetical protein